MFFRSFLIIIAATVLASASVAAAEDEKPKTTDDGKFDNLFDAPSKGSSMDALHKAASEVGVKESKAGDLAPKAAAADEEAPVKLHSVFAAEKIVMDKKLGCQAGGPAKKKVVEWTFNGLPVQAVPFDVCLTLSSKAGREMSMSVAVVDARNNRLVKAEDVVDFRGRGGRVDHVLGFPAPTFKTPGQHFYVIELDGKEAGRLPIFNVKVDAEPASAAVPVGAPR